MSRLLTMHLNNEEAYKFRYVLQTEIALTVTGIFVELIAEQSESLRIKRIQSEMGMTYNIIFLYTSLCLLHRVYGSSFGRDFIVCYVI